MRVPRRAGLLSALTTQVRVRQSLPMKARILDGCGVEITDLDLRTMNDAVADDVRGLFSRHGLAFFRDQSLRERDHIELAERFGPININRFFPAHPEFSEIAMVAKEPEQEGNIGGGWHTDHSYDFEPALGSILVARELPASGGDTWFTSMYKAHDALSDGLCETLAGLCAIHSARHIFGTASPDSDVKGDTGISNAEAADALVDPRHPMLIEHPLSGRKALYVNPGFTIGIAGWTKQEARPLLKYLYSVAMNEAFVTKFRWTPGSVAFWDNRATWHWAQNDYHGMRRIMHRITVEGCGLTAA